MLTRRGFAGFASCALCAIAGFADLRYFSGGDAACNGPQTKASVANRRSNAGLCNNHLRNRIRTGCDGYTPHASWN